MRLSLHLPIQSLLIEKFTQNQIIQNELFKKIVIVNKMKIKNQIENNWKCFRYKVTFSFGLFIRLVYFSWNTGLIELLSFEGFFDGSPDIKPLKMIIFLLAFNSEGQGPSNNKQIQFRKISQANFCLLMLD